jgi:hypothetical protein
VARPHDRRVPVRRQPQTRLPRYLTDQFDLLDRARVEMTRLERSTFRDILACRLGQEWAAELLAEPRR